MGSSVRLPIKRLTAEIVFSGLVIACRRAICPTSRSPLSVKATTEGVVRLPSELARTFGSPASIIATQELVVPKSIPITFAISITPRYFLSDNMNETLFNHRLGHFQPCFRRFFSLLFLVPSRHLRGTDEAIG